MAEPYDLKVLKRMASGVVFGGSVDQMNNLASDAGVMNIEEDRRTFSSNAVATQSTGADQVWQGATGTAFGGITGQGVGIAILDSGIAPHADLNNRLSASYYFTYPAVSWSRADWIVWPRTHVAGSIAERRGQQEVRKTARIRDGSGAPGQHEGAGPEVRATCRVIDRSIRISKTEKRAWRQHRRWNHAQARIATIRWRGVERAVAKGFGSCLAGNSARRQRLPVIGASARRVPTRALPGVR